jgi:hypothetical protein
MLLNKISKFHLIHFANVFVLFYLYSHDITFNDHGYYNIKFCFIIFIPILIIVIVIVCCLSIKKIIIVFIDWVKGLNNTSIDKNEKDFIRRIKIPKSCSYKIGKYFFDRYKISSPDCYKRYKRALQSRKFC